VGLLVVCLGTCCDSLIEMFCILGVAAWYLSCCIFQVDFFRCGAGLVDGFQPNIDNYRKRYPRSTSPATATSHPAVSAAASRSNGGGSTSTSPHFGAQPSFPDQAHAASDDDDIVDVYHPKAKAETTKGAGAGSAHQAPRTGSIGGRANPSSGSTAPASHSTAPAVPAAASDEEPEFGTAAYVRATSAKATAAPSDDDEEDILGFTAPKKPALPPVKPTVSVPVR
jgi:hypothetical protein